MQHDPHPALSAFPVSAGLRALVSLGALALPLALSAACGGSGGASDSPAPSAGAGEGVAREDLVLCDALEPLEHELARMAGFEAAPRRGFQDRGGECRILGASGAFVNVTLAPAVVPSVAEQAAAYAGEKASVPELGDRAVVVDDSVQPHVVFELLGHIVDVGVENFESPPSAETATAIARRVRDALRAANGAGRVTETDEG